MDRIYGLFRALILWSLSSLKLGLLSRIKPLFCPCLELGAVWLAGSIGLYNLRDRWLGFMGREVLVLFGYELQSILWIVGPTYEGDVGLFRGATILRP